MLDSVLFPRKNFTFFMYYTQFCYSFPEPSKAKMCSIPGNMLSSALTMFISKERIHQRAYITYNS